MDKINEMNVEMLGFIHDEKSKNERYNIKIDGANLVGFEIFFNNTQNIKIEGNEIKVQEVPQVVLSEEEHSFKERNLKAILDMLYYVLIENKNLYPDVKQVAITRL